MAAIGDKTLQVKECPTLCYRADVPTLYGNYLLRPEDSQRAFLKTCLAIARKQVSFHNPLWKISIHALTMGKNSNLQTIFQC